MIDKEVGELWAKHQSSVVGELIRKLVEERIAALENACEFNRFNPDRAWRKCKVDHEAEALRDFGIDPKEFNNVETNQTSSRKA